MTRENAKEAAMTDTREPTYAERYIAATHSCSIERARQIIAHRDSFAEVTEEEATPTRRTR